MAVNFFSSNLRILVGALEGTAGTMETLDASDFDVRVREPSVTYNPEFDNDSSKWANGNHGEDSAIPGVTSVSVSFNLRAVWGGAVNTAPNWSKFAQGCGLTEDAWASAGIGWHPRKSNDVKTMTLWIYEIQLGSTPAAVCHKVKGAMGNMTMGADGAGKPVTMNFEFTGVYAGYEDIANGSIPAAFGIDTTCADRMLMSQAYVGSTSQLITSWTLDLGNDIQPLYDQSEDHGIAYYHIAARNPRMSMNPLMRTVATDDILDRLVGGATGCPTTASLMVGDTGTDSKFAVIVPKAQLIEAGLESREGKQSWAENWRCLGNGVTGAVSDGDLEEEDTFEILQGDRS